ncbi:hypothetical protein JB92DRAFT_2837402 [Gautieria morchelliformis]|nr:hypothetical protein JB92DRAFT_2837402 [Gautieria morchelliformis]
MADSAASTLQPESKKSAMGLVQIGFTLIVGFMRYALATDEASACSITNWSLMYKTFFADLNRVKWILLVPYICAAVYDTIILASLCWYLYKTPTYFDRTQLLVNQLILYTVNTKYL